MMGILLLMFGPPVLFFIVAMVGLANKNKKITKLFLILCGLYLLIGLGICGIMLSNFSLDTK